MSAPGTKCYDLPRSLLLESGELLDGVRIAYRTWGTLDEDGGNAVLVCHALTGTPHADQWWSGLFSRDGAPGALDPAHDFVICSNILGGCSGSSGPASISPDGKRVGSRFPSITVRDMVVAQRELIRHLGVRRIRLVIGGSLGGMQVLEWAATFPELVDAIVPIATSGRHSAWCIGLSDAQRNAIFADPKWNDGDFDPADPPRRGLAIARMIAMPTYRSPLSFEERFARRRFQDDAFEVERYLRHHGEKLVARFDAGSYVTLTRAMDSHDLSRGRGSWESALRAIGTPALVVTIPSDVLYLPHEQEELARLLPHAELAVLDSLHGHDGFLIDTEPLNRIVLGFRTRLGATHADAGRSSRRKSA
ncbi:MAG: homoserine O-acetyltransferase [Thermoanaerobaculia bacterium]